jgi:hypothetical protein
MSPEIIFNLHLILGYVAWLLCFGAYVWPRLKSMDQVEAQRAIATLHSFRFFGLVFIVPGVVGPNLPASFATSAAYGDLVTSILAMLALKQPWGSVQVQYAVAEHLNHPDKYRASLFGQAEVRLFKGFSFNLFSEFSRTRDQIYLPRGEASTEEILLRQRQLLTGYQYFFNFGINYSFGSIFNNIVNPRFGGGGGFNF